MSKKSFNFSPYKQFLLAYADYYSAQICNDISKFPSLNHYFAYSVNEYKLVICRLSILLYITGYDNLYTLSYKFLTLQDDIVKSLYDDVKISVIKLHSLPPNIVKDYINSFFYNDMNILSLYE